MEQDFKRQREVSLVQRISTEMSNCAGPRDFAWEILRRRKDYSATLAVIERIAGAAAPIELIRPDVTAPRWGLRFQRSP